jgi:hypothetical protein
LSHPKLTAQSLRGEASVPLYPYNFCVFWKPSEGGKKSYTWKRARKLLTSHLEISVDSASARKRLMAEIKKSKKNRISA